MAFGLRNVVIVCSIITARIRLMLVGQVRNNHDKSWLLFAPLVGTPAGQVVSRGRPMVRSYTGYSLAIDHVTRQPFYSS